MRRSAEIGAAQQKIKGQDMGIFARGWGVGRLAK
jgi:hypothetical protein